MRKLYIYALYSEHNKNYVYDSVLCKNHRHAIFKYCQLLDKGKIVKKCRLHLIGEALFGSGGKLINVTPYMLPKEVHLTNFGKIICLSDYFVWKFKELLCKKIQNLMKNLSTICQKKKLSMQSVSV